MRFQNSTKLCRLLSCFPFLFCLPNIYRLRDCLDVALANWNSVWIEMILKEGMKGSASEEAKATFGQTSTGTFCILWSPSFMSQAVSESRNGFSYSTPHLTPCLRNYALLIFISRRSYADFDIGRSIPQVGRVCCAAGHKHLKLFTYSQ